MLRLRTTASLSLLALAVGVAGTQWLSGLTAGWAGPPRRVAAATAMAPLPHAAARASSMAAAPAHRHGPRPASPRPAPPRVVGAVGAVDETGAAAATLPPAEPAAPPLVPLDTPAVPEPYAALRGHLDGRVVLHLAVDGAGRVAAAAVSRSSGDPVLDAHALDTVRGWRFAVPADRPQGLEGELPMRFSSDAALARVP